MDDALLLRIADRDSNALAELYDRHAPLLFALLVRILRDRTEAEDALQDVFIRVWQRAETYNPVFGTPVAWLVRIARNRAIDRLRRRTAAPATEPAAAITREVEGGTPAPDQTAMTREQRRAIDGAMSLLSPEQRCLIECAFFGGYTQAELAERFGLPLGTVKTRIRRGMQTLRDQLQQIYKS
jgi:RNA polymerase sigma-70 factor (ECF subfamily)